MCISVMFIYAHVHGMFTIKFALDVHIYEAEWRHTALHQPTLGLNTPLRCASLSGPSTTSIIDLRDACSTCADIFNGFISGPIVVY